MKKVREYRPEDARRIEACFIELQDFERRLNPRRADAKEIAPEYLRHMFARCAETGGQVFVAEVEGAAVGFVSVWAKMESDEIEEKKHEYAYISDLVVLPAHRGRGLGRALMRRAEDYAREQGATLLKIGVLARNEVARRLYNDCGFHEHEVVLWKELQG